MTRLAFGAPDDAFVPAVAPIAPDPLLPEVSTPVKVTTVMELTTLSDNVAVTVGLLNREEENARQISEVPLCLFSRKTNAQVSPPPLTPVTVVFEPEV